MLRLHIFVYFPPLQSGESGFIMELALSRRCPSSVCANKDLSALLSLHGERHDPMSSAFLRKTPVTVPTDEPYFLCSAFRWQSELFSSFQYTFYSFIWCQSVRSLFLFYCQEAKLVTDLLFQGQIQAVSRGTSPDKNNRVTLNF